MLSYKTFLEEYIEEKKGSGAIRYNSEIGLLLCLLGGNAAKFNPNKPEISIPSNKLANPKETYNDIKKLLAPNFEKDTFAFWVNLGQKYSTYITRLK